MPMLATLIAFGATLLAAERVWPAAPQASDSGRLARNAAFGLIGIAIAPLLLAMQQRLFGGIPPLLDLTALPGGIVAQFLVFDLWVYATHRAFHEVRWLWPLHAPHHFDRTLDATSAVRFHPAELLLSALLRIVPCLAVGISPERLLIFEAILAGAALFHHSNLRLPPRLEALLSYVVVTPAIHWVHHHNRRADTDLNYASLLSIWDRLFGTRSPTPRTPTMTIGVGHESERTLPALLAYPFSTISQRISRGEGIASGPSNDRSCDGSP